MTVLIPIWYRYCASTELWRIQASDLKFRGIKFGGVPVILVFTKAETLRSSIRESLLQEYLAQNEDTDHVEDIGDIPEPERAAAREELEIRYQNEKEERVAEWSQQLRIFASSIFVSIKTRGKPTHVENKILRDTELICYKSLQPMRPPSTA
jgi:hypothetical protein